MSPEVPRPQEIITHVPGMPEAPEQPATDVPSPEATTEQTPEAQTTRGEVTPITNFSEAKAFKRWQDSQTPESQAAAAAMEQNRQRRAAEVEAQLADQAKRLAANPNAITSVPDSLK